MLGQVAGDHDLLEQPAEDKREPFLQVAGIPCPVPELRQELPGAHDRPRHDRGEEGHEQQHVQKRARRLVRAAVMIDGVGQPLERVKRQPYGEQDLHRGQRMAQDAGVEPGGACQRFQAQNEEFIILDERQQGHMQGHVQRDDAFPFARLPRKTGHQVDGTPVEHRHGQQQWDKGHARERIKKEIADEQKRPVFPAPLTQ